MAGQWLRLCPSIAGGVGFSLGQGTKIPYAAQCSQKIKQTNKQTKNNYASRPLESHSSLTTYWLSPLFLGKLLKFSVPQLPPLWGKCDNIQYLLGSLLLLFSCQVMTNSLWPHGLQHARPPCPSVVSQSLLKLMSIWEVKSRPVERRVSSSWGVLVIPGGKGIRRPFLQELEDLVARIIIPARGVAFRREVLLPLLKIFPFWPLARLGLFVSVWISLSLCQH